MAPPVGSYRRYRQMLALFPVVLIGYTAVAWSDLYIPAFPRHASGEIFPFFNWDLFSTAWQRGKFVTVRVKTVDGANPLAGQLVGRTLTEAGSHEFLRDPRFQKTATQLELAFRRKQQDLIREMKPQIDNFLRPYGIRQYDLVILRYDPIAFYRGEELVDPQFVVSLEVE
jgi:hypothetical protein